MIGISASFPLEAFPHPLQSIFTGQIKTRIALQPIMDLKLMNLYGYEVLARWQDHRPDIVFSVASKCDMVAELEYLILAAVQEYQYNLSYPLFVNVHPSLPDPYSWESLKDRGIILEITEAATIRYDALEILRDFGFALALDDLGTGSTTLESLARIQPEFIKLDRSLTQSTNLKARNSLIKAFVDHATRLNAKVIVEGIETREQLLAAQETGAHYGQGYLLGKPKLLQHARRAMGR